MCGTLSCMAAGVRAVQISGGSVRWVSTSITVYRSKRSVATAFSLEARRPVPNHLGLFEGGELVVGAASPLLQHFGVVLPQRGSGLAEPPFDARVPERPRRHRMGANHGMVDVLEIP